MKIAHIAPMWNTVPPRKYGGTERIISYLADTQTELGHDVTLFAPGQSKTKAKLISSLDEPLMDKGVSWVDVMANANNHSLAFSMADQFDIIHCHIHLIGAFFTRFTKTPIITTLHTIPDAPDWRWELFEKFKAVYHPAFISESQKARSPVQFPVSKVIHNGVDMSLFDLNTKPQDYFAWVGLITPIKGLHTAIAAAKSAGVKLKIAGKIDTVNANNKTYYEQTIKPLLNGDAEYVGELAGKELSEFYGNAQALIYPMEFEEPFGLVMIEAMACGTPVIVYNRGSVPEIVEAGKTGLVVNDPEGIIDAIKKIETINRTYCRQWVQNNLTKDIMCQKYLNYYQELINNT